MAFQRTFKAAKLKKDHAANLVSNVSKLMAIWKTEDKTEKSGIQ
jgi:hypothetical protein